MTKAVELFYVIRRKQMGKYLKALLCLALATSLTMGFSACSYNKTPADDPTETIAPTEDPESVEGTVISWSPFEHDEYWGKAELFFDSKIGYTLRENAESDDSCVITTMDDDTLRFNFYGMYYETGLESLILYMKSQNPDKLFFNEDTKLLIEVHSREKTEVNARINDSCCLTIIGPDLETIRQVLANVHIRIRGEEFDPLAGSRDLKVLYGQDE